MNMAEAAKIGLQDEVVKDTFLTCSICLERFNSPKILPCLHTFCLLCLDGHMEKTSSDGKFLCPCCRLVAKVPSTGAAEFRTNFFMNSLVDFFWGEGAYYTCAVCSLDSKTATAVSKCMDCSDYLCAECSSVHCRTRLTLKHNVVTLEINKDDNLTEKKTRAFSCSEHPEKTVGYFCNVCETTVCEDCRDLSHHDHMCITFQEAIKERMPILQEKIQWLTGQCQETETNLSGVEKYQVNLQQQLDMFVEEVKRIFQEISELKSQALQDAENSSEQLLKQSGKDLEEGRTRLAQLSGYKEYLTTAMERAADVELLDSFKMTNEHIESLREEDTSTLSDHLKNLSLDQYASDNSKLLTRLLSDCKKCLGIAKMPTTMKQRKKAFNFKSVKKIPIPLDKRCSGLALSEDGSLYACCEGKLYHYSHTGWENISSALGVGKVCGNATDVAIDGDTLFVLTTSDDAESRIGRLVIYDRIANTFTIRNLGSCFYDACICPRRDSSTLLLWIDCNFREVTGLTTKSSGRTIPLTCITECENGNILACDDNGSIHKFDQNLKYVYGSNDNNIAGMNRLRADGEGSVYLSSSSANAVFRMSSNSVSYQTVLCDKDRISSPGCLTLLGNKLAVEHAFGVWIYTLE